MNKKRILIPFLIALLGSIIMLTTLFLPYASSKGEYRELLTRYGSELYDSESSFTNAEAVDISLFEYARIYAELSRVDAYKAQCVLSIVLIVAFAVMALLTIIFAANKNAIGVIITDVLGLIVFGLNQFDFADRRVLPSSMYDWGIASTIPYIAGVLVLAGAIWLIVEKNMMKRYSKL